MSFGSNAIVTATRSVTYKPRCNVKEEVSAGTVTQLRPPQKPYFLACTHGEESKKVQNVLFRWILRLDMGWLQRYIDATGALQMTIW
jgi:hypothetical protein